MASEEKPPDKIPIDHGESVDPYLEEVKRIIEKARKDNEEPRKSEIYRKAFETPLDEDNKRWHEGDYDRKPDDSTPL